MWGWDQQTRKKHPNSSQPSGGVTTPSSHAGARQGVQTRKVRLARGVGHLVGISRPRRQRHTMLPHGFWWQPAGGMVRNSSLVKELSTESGPPNTEIAAQHSGVDGC